MRRGIKILKALYTGIKELPDEIALPTSADQRVPAGTRISPPYYLYNTSFTINT
jgi:hypothetical protein